MGDDESKYLVKLAGGMMRVVKAAGELDAATRAERKTGRQVLEVRPATRDDVTWFDALED